jgi:hypothetical protein
MDFEKFNTIAYRIVCILICLFLIIGGIGACINHQYIKGVVGFVVTPIVIFIGTRQASLTNWVILVTIFLVTMYFVGAIGN